MFRPSVRLAAGLAGLWIAAAVPAGDGPPPRRIPGWGEVVDPSGDCKVALDSAGDRLTIAVPGGVHVLSAEVAGLPLGAPRVVREIDGDFKISVRVAGKLDPGGAKTTDYDPYHGAGLIVWKDERNYLRLERAVATIQGRSTPYINDELREGGHLAFSRGHPAPDRPISLKIERTGGRIRSWWSSDGSRWAELPGMRESMSGRVRVGVLAINSARLPLKAELDRLRFEGSGSSGDPGGATVAEFETPAHKASEMRGPK